MRKQRLISLCLASALALSLAACNSPTDEQNSAQPTPSTQPTAAPTPTPTPPIPFTDVAQDSTYYDAVVWAYKNGIASDGETFGPADVCTRGQVMTFLWRAKGSPEPQATESPFSDVSSADWFYKPALWASENGIATGTAFNPGNSCTNGEALTFLWRAEGKPAASVYNSAVALAASGQYYARPAAWAETNGLFAGTEFDPAAPCSRANLMTYLHWVTEQWKFAEEDKIIQAEFEQIINDARLYEVHSSGLIFADYLDVDNDGRVELLTVELDRNKNDGDEVIARIYINSDGHAEKIDETVFPIFSGTVSIYKADNQLYLCYFDISGNAVNFHDFYRIGKESFVCENRLTEEYGITEEGAYSYYDFERKISEDEYYTSLKKYTNEKELFNTGDGYNMSVKDRGSLPNGTEYCLANREKIYEQIKNGDFSFFAGQYMCEYGGGILTLDASGTLNVPELYDEGLQTVSVTALDNGIVYCEFIPGYLGEFFEIYPVGVDMEYYHDNLGKIRIRYVRCEGGMLEYTGYKIS